MVPSTRSLPCSIVLGSRGCGGFGLTQCDVGKHNVWITTARKSLTRPDPARLVAAVERFRLFKGSDFSPRTDAFCIGDPEIQSPARKINLTQYKTMFVLIEFAGLVNLRNPGFYTDKKSRID